MTTIEWEPWQMGPAEPAPVPPARRPGSIRRTSTLRMFWPGGYGTDLHLVGRARDLHTPAQGNPVVVTASELYAVTGLARDIKQIEADPPVADLEKLVGRSAGGNLRKAIAEEVPAEVEAGTPLFLLLDDMAGATLIAGYAYFRWADVVPAIRERLSAASTHVMEGVCSGFRPGSNALYPDGTLKDVSPNTPLAPPLTDPADPFSWHEIDEETGMAMRRARRIDVWDVDGRLEFDAMFRDSCWTPGDIEVVLHEYRLEGSADPESGRLLDVRAIPLVLPYAECPGAVPHVARMIDTPLPAMRTEVLKRLRSSDCCTHLNDALRSLAEVPVLARSLAA